MKLKIGEMPQPVRPEIGPVLLEQGFTREAFPYLLKAAELEPMCSMHWSNLGVCWKDFGNFDQAIYCLKRAIELDPKNSGAWHNLGMTYEDQSDWPNAVKCFDSAYQIDPRNSLSQQGMVECWLREGIHTEETWKVWESHRWWRIVVQGIPVWNGEPLKGKRILVLREGGHGDIFMFLRYFELLKEKGAHVTFYGLRQHKDLLADHIWIDRNLTQDDEIDTEDFDYQVSLFSLMSIIKVVPWIRVGPYILPYLDGERRERFTVGMCLETGEVNKNFRKVKCIDAQAAEALRECDADFIGLTLQKPPEWIEHRPEILKLGWKRTAEIIASCHVIVTADTAVAHLAGAMGRPVFCMLPMNSDWRWFKDTQSCPWYPSMRLFRNRDPLNWTAVMRTVADECKKLQIELCRNKPSREFQPVAAER